MKKEKGSVTLFVLIVIIIFLLIILAIFFKGGNSNINQNDDIKKIQEDYMEKEKNVNEIYENEVKNYKQN